MFREECKRLYICWNYLYTCDIVQERKKGSNFAA